MTKKRIDIEIELVTDNRSKVVVTTKVISFLEDCIKKKTLKFSYSLLCENLKEIMPDPLLFE